MQHLIEKYLKKLESQGLADKESAVFLALDAELVSNKPIKDDVLKLSKVFDMMNINTLLFSEPSEPYKSIINELIEGQRLEVKGQENFKKIIPMDCETRTFFHDIPIIDSFSPDAIAKALSHRKSAIIRDRGIVTYGVITPEQAFVSFSSTCFSTFVKYFYDALLYFEECRAHNITSGGKTIWGGDDEFAKKFNKICELLEGHVSAIVKNSQLSAFSLQPNFTTSPANEDDVIKMLSEAGRAVVEYHLVDSYFGNISYVFGDKIYISQTGSSMDELECCIDAVPLDGSSSVGITSSSELSAHKNIYYTTGDNAILHGHPKFAVIMSMYCDKRECEYYFSRDMCHKGCKVKRDILGIPIVSGEIGRGPTALMHTVPLAMREGKGVIVYGHGVFTSGRDSFQKPFEMLMDIENRCWKEYFAKLLSFPQS